MRPQMVNMLPSENKLEGEVGSREEWGYREIRQLLSEEFTIQGMRVKVNPIPGNAIEYAQKLSYRELGETWLPAHYQWWSFMTIPSSPSHPVYLCLGLSFPHPHSREGQIEREGGRRGSLVQTSHPPLAINSPTSVAIICWSPFHLALKEGKRRAFK